MASTAAAAHNPALDPDTDAPDDPGHELAEFGAGCFWGVELAFQRVVGLVRTEVGYSQGHVPDPNYKLVCSGTTNHVEVVRVHFDPKVCPYTSLLSTSLSSGLAMIRQASIARVVMWEHNIDQEYTTTMRTRLVWLSNQRKLSSWS
ncbi:hypothetical protein CIPAW_12G033800 [Carya illinoinensis]|uniref:Protein-methionine-S-oxide reductase n=1 Tax=Carya illinoinensis TaxID=32201 RepID=A0A8T1NT30_CARIL|nr:hypothetical protein CIPAW_12G033800 [Carya illinoinensis]